MINPSRTRPFVHLVRFLLRHRRDIWRSLGWRNFIILRHRFICFIKYRIFDRHPYQSVFFINSPKHHVPSSPAGIVLGDLMGNSSRLLGGVRYRCGNGVDGLDLGRGSRRFVREFKSLRVGGRDVHPIAMRSPASPRFGCWERRGFHGGRQSWRDASGSDPRIGDAVGRGRKERRIIDDFKEIRENYATPKNPIVLAHGLMGFSELKIAGNLLPGIEYWRGITEAMVANKIEVIITSVPPSGSIEERAEKLRKDIVSKAGGKKVNIIAHSMGGLDARYMISRLMGKERRIGGEEGGDGDVEVASLTTIATPHRGSAVADYVVGDDTFSNPHSTLESTPNSHSAAAIGKFAGKHILYNFLTTLGLSTAAFSQLTRSYLRNEFNPNTPDVDGVRYLSYGASFKPRAWNAFRFPYRVMERAGEGDNDGLVSVESSMWGTYKGTLVGVDHLDLINWTNRLRWAVWEGVGKEENFNAMAFYLDIADMLAKEGL